METSFDLDLEIRCGRPLDDIRCGQIVAAAWMASDVPDRLPHAIGMFDDGAPLKSDGRLRLIAQLPNLVAGFADVDTRNRHIWYLFVEPDLQGLGIGAALLDEAQRIVDGTITLQCLADGRKSLSWYRAHGFQTMGNFHRPLCGRDVGWVRLSRAKSWLRR